MRASGGCIAFPGPVAQVTLSCEGAEVLLVRPGFAIVIRKVTQPDGDAYFSSHNGCLAIAPEIPRKKKPNSTDTKIHDRTRVSTGVVPVIHITSIPLHVLPPYRAPHDEIDVALVASLALGESQKRSGHGNANSRNSNIIVSIDALAKGLESRIARSHQQRSKSNFEEQQLGKTKFIH